jgi:hypothetical protein
MLVNKQIDVSETVKQASTHAGDDCSIEAYREFLRRKASISKDYGIPFTATDVHPSLKPHQRDTVLWACRGGRRAIFAAFGLGKTRIQLEILRLILSAHDGFGLIVVPLGVRQEFQREADALGTPIRFIRRFEETGQAELDGAVQPRIFTTNYETIRDEKLDPAKFTVTSLDEAAVLRSFGGTLTYRVFLDKFAGVKYRFIATATPDPNEYIELLAYAAYLGVMDVSAAKTRWFKRDSTKADHLTLQPHRADDFWLWVSSWGLFLQRPSDLGYSDEGYDLPEMKVIYHMVKSTATPAENRERDGQAKLFRDALGGVSDAAREKRDSLPQRLDKMKEILKSNPGEHFVIWHDLEAERRSIEKAVPEAVAVYGNQEMEEREQSIIAFSDGKLPYLASKPVMLGAGCNFQRHCARAIFLGIGFKFYQWIQAVHRIYRFLQDRPVEVHLIYAESERGVLQNLKSKWKRYEERGKRMSEIIKQYGLSQQAMIQTLVRQMGAQRVEVCGEKWKLVNNDCVEEIQSMADNGVHLILTSVPFSTQYEYSPSYNDFGHTESNDHFFQQMDFLTPHLLRVLQPGRIAAIHVKDRIVPGGLTGLGFQVVYPFHCDCIRHYIRHGFGFLGMKTIVTDVVRENNQTYRLGWTEECKDGSKMGVGMPEYLLLFRKPPTDNSNAYADTPVVKLKRKYTRSRWQIDAHGFSRSAGNRLLNPEEISALPHDVIFRLFSEYSLRNVYDYEYHVRLGEVLEEKQRLPVTFMLLQPQSWHPDVWTDIMRARTLNMTQSRKGKTMHLCPMQFDIAERVIRQFSMEGEIVFDPFAGLGTVPMIAVKLGRAGLGIELSIPYFLDSCAYLESAAREIRTPSLFDVVDTNAPALAHRELA